MQRVRSTQKLPTVFTDARAKARISAISSAMPVAADTKFCVRETEHLGQIAQRAFAAVVLPVGVGR